MVVAQHQAKDMADGDGIVSVLVRDDRRFFEDAAHAEDGYLRLKNDGRSELRTVDTRIGDGDGAALHVIGFELLAACALTQVRDGPLQADKAQVLRAFYHRN